MYYVMHFLCVWINSLSYQLLYVMRATIDLKRKGG
jgi:hypothetical protein